MVTTIAQNYSQDCSTIQNTGNHGANQNCHILCKKSHSLVERFVSRFS